jgi:hypothetical protein
VDAFSGVAWMSETALSRRQGDLKTRFHYARDQMIMHKIAHREGDDAGGGGLACIGRVGGPHSGRWAIRIGRGAACIGRGRGLHRAGARPASGGDAACIGRGRGPHSGGRR